MTQYVDVIIQGGMDGIPVIAGAPLLFRYERTLGTPGIYQLVVQVSGRNSPPSAAAIEMQWTLSDHEVRIDYVRGISLDEEILTGS
jgi:hypothetical protein